jgi:TonB family protein
MLYKKLQAIAGLMILILTISFAVKAQSENVPKTAEDYFKRGIEYKNKDENDAAINDFTEAIKLKPDYSEAFFERGLSLRSKSKTSESAINDFTQALFRSPDVANYYYQRGLSYYVREKYQLAIEDFTKAIALSPKASNGYRVRFEAYRKLKDFSNALKDIDQAIELQPDSLELHFGRGVLLADMSDCAKSDQIIAEFSGIIAKNPNFPIVYGTLKAGYELAANCLRKTATGNNETASRYEETAWKQKKIIAELNGENMNSRALILGKPIYPSRVTIIADVSVKVTVSGNGIVVKAEYSGNHEEFKESVEAAAMATKFPPTIIDGKPIETTGTLFFYMVPPNTQGSGNGNGGEDEINKDGYWVNQYLPFVTEQLVFRKYLPGDTKKLESSSISIWNVVLPTTNSAILFSPIEPPAQKPFNRPFKISDMPIAVYTEKALAARIEGIVRLRIVFLSNGTVGNISVVSGLPDGLTESAIAAARKIKFEPEIVNGSNTSASKQIEFRFVLPYKVP